MKKKYFVQQNTFFKDYTKVVKDETIEFDALAAQVINQLNETQEEYFTLKKEQSKDHMTYHFPFRRRIYTDENDGTLNTEYTYEGDPYVLPTEKDQ